MEDCKSRSASNSTVDLFESTLSFSGSGPASILRRIIASGLLLRLDFAKDHDKSQQLGPARPLGFWN